MKKIALLLLMAAFALTQPNALAQRKMEKMDRGVVAIWRSSTQLFVSWRYLATDPESISFNVYRQFQSGEPTKLNSTPITKTNLMVTLTTNAFRDWESQITVKPVINGVEGEAEGSWKLLANATSRIVRDYNFATIPGVESVMPMKFCWPADLDGDGKYDFVLDRQNYGATEEDGSGGSTDYPYPRVEAYSSEGVFKWRVNVGPNIKINNGHADMVTAYDMDNDSKAEVMMIVGEGSIFAEHDPANRDTVKTANGTITDYRPKPGSAPQWLSIVDGETGREIDRTEIPHFNELPTTRTDSWKDVNGHFVIAYLDGINPSLIYSYKNRRADGGFQGGLAAWRFIGKKLVLQWSHTDYPNQNEFHQVRVADVDGDGCDEFVEGGYVIDHDGSMLTRFQDVVHGDRHTVSDADPDRPGLEHFIIQQDNPKTLGMGLFDAATGELVKGVYQSSVGDVGRGACAAIDPNTRGLQFWSTMQENAIFDCKGIETGGKGTFPGEPLWWDGDLSREHTAAADGNGKNFIIDKYSTSSKSFGRLEWLYNENNGGGTYYFRSTTTRAAFWGDILGDWREELIFVRNDDKGFVIISTYDETNHHIYNLMQNPGYRGQTTARGYYQTPDVDYYLATDMPQPPVAPVQKADLYYTGAGWIDDNNVTATYTDGKSIMFDIRSSSNAYTLSSNIAPSRVWIMNPKGKDYTFGGTGKLTGGMDLIKSMQGTATLNGNHDYTGITRVSEGKLLVNDSLASAVRVDARGVIGGSGKLNGGATFETGLNIEGGRIEPGNGAQLGALTIAGNVTLPGRNNLVFDVDQTKSLKNDTLIINGNLTVSGDNHSIVINALTKLEPDTLTLVCYTGTTNATVANFKLVGVDGIPYTLIVGNGKIKIAINEARAAGSVNWRGNTNGVWDFQALNFLSGGQATAFVPGDTVTFTDDAVFKSIFINENMPVGGMTFNNEADYTITGSGAISGSGGLTKTGAGALSLLNAENTFTGAVKISDGTLVVSSLKSGGLASSIGASSSDSTNWIMSNATLQTAGQTATDRNMQVIGKLTINNPQSNNNVMLGGRLSGSGISLEVIGSGTVNLQGANSFDSVILRGGLLTLGSANANNVSLGKGKVRLLGGTFRMFNSNETSVTGPFTNEVEVPAGYTARWELPQRWRFTNKLTGGGTITINSPYVRADLNGDWSAFTGSINFTGSEIRMNTPEARNLGKAEVNLGSGTSTIAASNGSATQHTGIFTFGALSGEGGIAGRNSLVIGDKNVSSTYSGVISAGAGSLTKRGTGALTLSGANAYTGGTTVNGGRLIVTNTTGSATGTGAVAVNDSATLMGTGTILGRVTVNAGGTIMPGASDAAIGTLKTGELIMESGSTVAIKVVKPQKDMLVVTGKLTLKNVNLRIINRGTSFTEGDSLIIFSSTIGIALMGTVTVSELSEGLMWDISSITRGVIKVKRKSAGATVAAPTLNSVTHNSITINAVAAPGNGQSVEYAISPNTIATGSTWQDNLTFGGLSEQTTYYIFARAKANGTHSAGATSEYLSVTTTSGSTDPTGVESAGSANPLKAWVQGETLYVSGLVAGKLWRIYGVSGALVHQGSAAADTEELRLNLSDGVYIASQGRYSVKILVK